MAKSDQLRLAALGIGGASLAFVLFGGLGAISGGGASSDPFDAMPKTSFLVATVDVEELRRSPVFEAVVGKDGKDGKDSVAADPLRRALGMDSLADACGFDPLGRVQRLAVALPEEGERGEFGLAARVDVTRAELEKCTRAITERRGGEGAKTETKEVGSFAIVESGSTNPKSKLGYGRGGLLVVGKGAWFDAMIAAADHKGPGVRDAQEHVALRNAITSREGWKRPTLLVTALLPRALRDRLKGEMGTEGADPSAVAMGGVLGVSAVGAALNAGGPNRATEATVELVCDTPAGCEAVEKLILRKRLEWSKELSLRMVGLGPLIDSLQVTRDGGRLRASASSDAAALAQTVERILKLRSRERPAPPPTPTPLPAPQKESDESIRAKPPAPPGSRP